MLGLEYCSLKTIPNEKSIVMGVVDHTQKLNLPPLKPWALYEKAGRITAAHCTCTAGLGESCTHVGALLFGVESLVRTHANVSKTDVLCTWNGPFNSIGIVHVKRVGDMTFPSKKEDSIIVPPQISTKKICDILKEIKKDASKAPVAFYIAENLTEEFSTWTTIDNAKVLEQVKIYFCGQRNSLITLFRTRQYLTSTTN